MSDEMAVAHFLTKTGWTYDEYLAQPVWLVEKLRDIWNLTAEYHNKKPSN